MNDEGWMESNEDLRTIGVDKKEGLSAIQVQTMARPGQTWQTKKSGNLVIGAVFNHGVATALDGKITSFEDLVEMLRHECGAELDSGKFCYSEDFALIDHFRTNSENDFDIELWYLDSWIPEAVADELRLDPHEVPLVRWHRNG